MITGIVNWILRLDFLNIFIISTCESYNKNMTDENEDKIIKQSDIRCLLIKYI